MSKLVRVGDLPKTIRVNFALDSTKHPDLAQWLYAMPYGTMSENIREILVLAARGQLRRTDGNPLLGDHQPISDGRYPSQRPGNHNVSPAAPEQFAEHAPPVVSAAVFDPLHAIPTKHSAMPPIGAPLSPAVIQALESGGGVLDEAAATENARTIGDLSDSM